MWWCEISLRIGLLSFFTIRMLSRPSSCVLSQRRGQSVATYRALGSKGRVSYTSATGSQTEQAIDIRSASHSSFDRRQALLSFGTVAGWMAFMESPAQAEGDILKSLEQTAARRSNMFLFGSPHVRFVCHVRIVLPYLLIMT